MPGTNDSGWWPIRDQLAQTQRVFLYDRANLGRSDPASLPRTLNEFRADLCALLRAAKVEPPYVLVGSSFGGMLVTHYASLYPAEVLGILLLDAPHPEVDLRTLELLPPQTPDEPRSLAEFRQLAWQEQYAPLETFEREGLDAPASIVQAADTWNLGDITLIVLTAGTNEYGPDFPGQVIADYEALWLEQQKQYAALSTRSTQQVVEDSDHVIHFNKPELVIEAIKQLIHMAG